MIEDLKSSALAFVYAWAVILVPLSLTASVISLVAPQAEQSV